MISQRKIKFRDASTNEPTVSSWKNVKKYLMPCLNVSGYVILSGFLCYIVLSLLFWLLPNDAFFEYAGEFTAIELTNVTTIPWQSYESSMRIHNTKRITFNVDAETTFDAMAMRTFCCCCSPSLIAWRDRSTSPHTEIVGRTIYIRPRIETYPYSDEDNTFSLSVHRVNSGYYNTFDLSLQWLNGNTDMSIMKNLPQTPITSIYTRGIPDHQRNRGHMNITNISSAEISSRHRFICHSSPHRSIWLTGSFRIYDRYSHELILCSSSVADRDSRVRLVNFSFFVENLPGISIEVVEETSFTNLNLFNLDSFNARNEHSGKVRFAQSAHPQDFNIINAAVYATSYSEPLVGQIRFADGVFNVDISGVVSNAKIANYSLFPNFRQWMADNSLIVASTILSSFIGFIFISKKKDDKCICKEKATLVEHPTRNRRFRRY